MKLQFKQTLHSQTYALKSKIYIKFNKFTQSLLVAHRKHTLTVNLSIRIHCKLYKVQTANDVTFLQSLETTTKSEVTPVLSNDAKTQDIPNELANSPHDRRLTKKAVPKPRTPHLVLKRTKASAGQGTSQKRHPKRSELVFLQPSPNYCEPDLAQGSLGTQGRFCNRTSKGPFFYLCPFIEPITHYD